MDNFSSNDFRTNNKKFNFGQKKDCCVQSLKDVNCFLCNVKKAKKAILLFKWLK